MTNKIIVGILVFLMLIAGGLGTYSAILNGQINTLSSELATFQREATTKISGVRGDISTLGTELTAFKQETATGISDVSGDISTLETKLTSSISSVNGKVSRLDSELTTFKSATTSQIADVAEEVSRSTMNVPEIYQSVSQSLCEITDGEEILGSGFVFDAGGHIVTAQHVIDGLSNIDVILYDGTISSASVVGSDKYSDVAVLKLEKTVTLEPLEFADSSTVALGEAVITLGSPFELSGTVTSGIVSQTNGAENYMDDWITSNLIQYDAASNPGNSGGPVVNSRGELVGMTVAGVLPKLGSGIYWAVSSDRVKRVAEAIIESGSFENPTLPGTWELSNLTSESAEGRNVGTTNGALFLKASGLDSIQANDIVVTVDEVPVDEAADLFNYFGLYKSPGDTVTLTVTRGGTEVEVTVKLVEGAVREVNDNFGSD